MEIYDPGRDSWTRVNKMQSSRDSFVGVVLGKAILAIGGYNGLGALESVEICPLENLTPFHSHLRCDSSINSVQNSNNNPENIQNNNNNVANQVSQNGQNDNRADNAHNLQQNMREGERREGNALDPVANTNLAQVPTPSRISNNNNNNNGNSGNIGNNNNLTNIQNMSEGTFEHVVELELKQGFTSSGYDVGRSLKNAHYFTYYGQTWAFDKKIKNKDDSSIISHQKFTKKMLLKLKHESKSSQNKISKSNSPVTKSSMLNSAKMLLFRHFSKHSPLTK